MNNPRRKYEETGKGSGINKSDKYSTMIHPSPRLLKAR
jgi:hypothetical protein